MLTKEQKKQLFLLMEDLPKYIDYVPEEQKKNEMLSYLAELVRADDETQELLYRRIFIEKNYPLEYKHPSVYIKRFFDHQ